MQLSAANLLLAAQQMPKPAQAAQPGFSAALEKEKTVSQAASPEAFEALSFKPAETAPIQAAARPAMTAGAPIPLGQSVDIRV